MLPLVQIVIDRGETLSQIGLYKDNDLITISLSASLLPIYKRRLVLPVNLVVSLHSDLSTFGSSLGRAVSLSLSLLSPLSHSLSACQGFDWSYLM